MSQNRKSFLKRNQRLSFLFYFACSIPIKERPSFLMFLYLFIFILCCGLAQVVDFRALDWRMVLVMALFILTFKFIV